MHLHVFTVAATPRTPPFLLSPSAEFRAARRLPSSCPPRRLPRVRTQDLGFDDVGFRSHEINTPTIDKLAEAGVVLDQYYVQDVCSPSRSTFMTGRCVRRSFLSHFLFIFLFLSSGMHPQRLMAPPKCAHSAVGSLPHSHESTVCT